MEKKNKYSVALKDYSRYWGNVTKIFRNQREKGITKYGKPLEENTACIEDRITHLQEEMVDGLMYAEWVKELIVNERLLQKPSFDDYQKKAMRTMNNKLSIKELATQACLGMAGEVGEVCNLWEKHRSQGHNFVEIMGEISLELGDILWYLTLCCEAFGLELGDIAKANIEKLERRYSEANNNVSFSTEKSERRKDTDG